MHSASPACRPRATRFSPFIMVKLSSASSTPRCVTCPAGTVVVTGDFKIDYTPVDGHITDLASFAELGERGVLAQFRHQHFLMFLIVHFQKAALLMFSDRLVVALDALQIHDASSVKRFKRAVRGNFETFLRFTHRYWFHDLSEQAQTRALHRLCADHLGLDTLHPEVRERVSEMNTYLDTDSLRRQANTVVRLTVVTIAGLIGTLSTGFLGMNLLDEADRPWSERLLILGLTLLASLLLTGYMIVRSKSLSDFLDVLSDERLTVGQKLGLRSEPGGGRGR
mgnify:CR=1 FL=1